LAIVQEPAVVHTLFEKAGERFGQTAGGYTRLAKLGARPGDAAPMTLVELIGAEAQSKKKKKGRKKAAPAPKGKKKAAAKAPETTAAPTAKEASEAPAAESSSKEAS
jgi:large subunit ribosomal protein L17